MAVYDVQMFMVQVTPLAAGLGPALAVLSTLLAAAHSESAARALLSLYQQEQRHTQMSEAVSHLQEMLAKADEQEKELVEFATSLGQLQANVKTP